MKPPLRPHYDPARDRWFMLWTAGASTGCRVQVTEEDYSKLPSYFTAQACGADDEYVMCANPITGEREDFVDYSLRFFTKEGAEFFIHQIAEYSKMLDKFDERMRAKREAAFANV